ncbi:MAG TPA: 30S ribosomal protein S8 [Candidatus Nanoarchaeia archaeon]|nr:30S ribosomal protein S8 [Candidatus Nanoarchaeia archaeon]
MLNDPLATMLSNILNAEKVGRQSCDSKPSSKILKKVLEIFNKNSYVGSYEEVNDNRGGILKINLIGNINNCGVIKPRFSVKKDNFEKFEKRFLPAEDFGLLIVSTPKGIMTHYEAKEKKLGGKLICFVY